MTTATTQDNPTEEVTQVSSEDAKGGDAQPATAVATSGNDPRAKLQAIRSEMKLPGRLIERDPEIDLVVLSILAKAHGVFVGTGGVAKSMTIDSFFEHLDVPLFKVMLRKSMPPEEIFGPLSITGLKNDQFRYVTKGRLAEVYGAFIDEIFKGNAVVLNAMLMAINERLYINDGVPIQIPLWSVFGASNELPNEPELAAFRDRFAWVKEVKPVSTDANFKAVLSGALTPQNLPPLTRITVPEIEQAQAEVAKIDVSGVLDSIATMKRRAEGEFNLYISARRYISALRICQAQAWLNGRAAVIDDDLTLFQHSLWTDIEDAPAAYEVTLDYAGKMARVAQQLRASFEPYHNDLAQVRGEIDPNVQMSQEIAGKVAMIQMNLKQVTNQIDKQIEEGRSDQRDVGELESLRAEVIADRDYIRTEILG